MKKNLNKEYERLNGYEKVYDGYRTIVIEFDDNGYDYKIFSLKDDKYYDYYEGKYID